MKPDEIKVGGYYVMQGSGVIRHFFALTPRGRALYRTYDPLSGEYILTCTCSTENLVYRAERKATPEEISRLQEWRPYTETQRSSLGKALKRTSDKRW